MTAADRRREKKHIAALGELKVGDPVWYRPSVVPGAQRFEAVVAGEVRMLGDTPVVNLGDLPESYGRLHHPDTMRTTVPAAALFAIERRLTIEQRVQEANPAPATKLDLKSAKHFYNRLQQQVRAGLPMTLTAEEAKAVERVLYYIGSEKAFPTMDVENNASHALTQAGRRKRFAHLRGVHAYSRDT